MPMFLRDVELGVHNPTLYGLIYFLINFVPILLLIETKVFYDGHSLGGLTTIQTQTIIALTCTAFWMAVLAILGFLVDRVHRTGGKGGARSE